MVIPKTIQLEILRRLHEDHMDIEKVLFRARSAIIWPGLAAYVTIIVRSSLPEVRYQTESKTHMSA